MKKIALININEGDPTWAVIDGDDNVIVTITDEVFDMFSSGNCDHHYLLHHGYIDGTTNTQPEMKIHVNCAKAQEAGFYYGDWIDLLDCPRLEVERRIKKILKSSPYSTLTSLDDIEQVLNSIVITETKGFPNRYTLKELLHFLSDLNYDEDNIKASLIWLNHKNGTLTEAIHQIENYWGKHESEIAFTQTLVDESGWLNNCPQYLRKYFDYAAASKELFSDEYINLNGNIFST